MHLATLLQKSNRCANITHLLEKYNGSLGSANSVAWMFEKKGYIVVDKAAADEEKLLTTALDAGADDMRDDGDSWEVLTDPSAFETVRDAVKGLGIEPASAQFWNNIVYANSNVAYWAGSGLASGPHKNCWYGGSGSPPGWDMGRVTGDPLLALMSRRATSLCKTVAPAATRAMIRPWWL